MFVGVRYSEVKGIFLLLPREPLARVVQTLFQGFGPFPQDVPENFCFALAEVHL